MVLLGCFVKFLVVELVVVEVGDVLFEEKPFSHCARSHNRDFDRGEFESRYVVFSFTFCFIFTSEARGILPTICRLSPSKIHAIVFRTSIKKDSS